ncbi:MAG: ZIP family metal transporter [Candidatus Uhrbacteria bacterium]
MAIAAIISGLIAGAATLLGMWLVLAREQWARRQSVYLIAFSVGVLISAAFTEIIPEAVGLFPAGAFGVVLATFFASYVLEHSLLGYHHHVHSDCSEQSRTPIEHIAFLGLLVHSLVDGLVIGAGFEVSKQLGVLATLAVVLHEVPEGITTIALFLHAGQSRRRAIIQTLVVALATPVGAIVMALVPGLLTPVALGALLAVAGGSFLYVAAADFVPETHRARHVPAILLMLLGVAVPIIVERFF